MTHPLIERARAAYPATLAVDRFTNEDEVALADAATEWSEDDHGLPEGSTLYRDVDWIVVLMGDGDPR